MCEIYTNTLNCIAAELNGECGFITTRFMFLNIILHQKKTTENNMLQMLETLIEYRNH